MIIAGSSELVISDFDPFGELEEHRGSKAHTQILWPSAHFSLSKHKNATHRGSFLSDCCLSLTGNASKAVFRMTLCAERYVT